MAEERYAGQFISEIPDEEVPPCFAERVNFLSPKPQRRLARHAYAKTSEHHKHISNTPFTHPAFSAAATPFGGPLKIWGRGERRWRKGKIDNHSIAERYGIDFRPDYEPEEPDLLNARPDGFKVTLIRKHCSMGFSARCARSKASCFVYAKRTPLIDDDQWMIVGVGRIASIGDLTRVGLRPAEKCPIRSYLWERSVCHGIRPMAATVSCSPITIY